MSILTQVRHMLHQGAKLSSRPDRSTSRGVGARTWQRIQVDHELNFWVRQYPNEVPAGRGLKEHYALRYWPLNASMFKTLRRHWAGCRVLDVGCGPFGSLPFDHADLVLGLDPLANEYQHHYGFDKNFLILPSPAESIPLLDESVDVVVCINAIDHFQKPYVALDEMLRVCRTGGHFVLATDINGTPAHPCHIRQDQMEQYLSDKKLEVIEQDCGPHIPSSWPEDCQIPVFVCHACKP